MMTLLIFTLLALTLFLHLFRQHKLSLSCFIMAFALFFLTGSGILSYFLLPTLESPYISLSNPQWKTSNAIILLGGGNVKLPNQDTKPTLLAYSRLLKTLQLYHSCKKTNASCTILISGGDPLKTGQSEAEAYRDQLVNTGINKADIVLEPNSMNTYQNAEFTSAILKTKHFDTVVLVTSAIHMKRSLLYFKKFGITPTPVIADYIPSILFPLPIGYLFTITDFTLHEYAGILRLHVYEYFHWNAQTTSAGAV